MKKIFIGIVLVVSAAVFCLGQNASLKFISSTNTSHTLAGGGDANTTVPLKHYELIDLGALLGTNSYALGINNHGEVVGYRQACLLPGACCEFAEYWKCRI